MHASLYLRGLGELFSVMQPLYNDSCGVSPFTGEASDAFQNDVEFTVYCFLGVYIESGLS